MAHKTWVVADVPEDLLVQAQDEVMWRTVLGRVGAEWRLLADEPDDPAVN
jgi:putative transcriptional regulator